MWVSVHRWFYSSPNLTSPNRPKVSKIDGSNANRKKVSRTTNWVFRFRNQFFVFSRNVGQKFCPIETSDCACTCIFVAKLACLKRQIKFKNIHCLGQLQNFAKTWKSNHSKIEPRTFSKDFSSPPQSRFNLFPNKHLGQYQSRFSFPLWMLVIAQHLWTS